jgi:cobalt-zinc-cadmium efflux system membrane fusion protein
MNTNLHFILALFLVACGPSDTGTSEEESTPGSMSVEQVLSSSSAIKIGPLESRMVQNPIQCIGRIEIPPSEFISIHSRVKGQVAEINYLPGDRVRKGSSLFRINDPAIIVAQRHFAETKVELDQLEKEYQRQLTLFNAEASSEKAFEEVQSNRDLLQTRYEGMRSELQLIGIDVEGLINQQRYQSYISIRAPENGYIHDILVNKGQMINPEDVLLEMANDDHIHAELMVQAKDASLIAIDQKVHFRVSQDPTVYSAKIVKVNRMLDDRSGTLRVHCHIDEEHLEKIRAGMTIHAEIETAVTERTGLPAEAVVKEGDSYFGYMVKNDSLVKMELSDVLVIDDFVSFSSPPGASMVTAGAYYIE